MSTSMGSSSCQPPVSTMMMRPILSKLYCSVSQAVLVIRKRPHVVSGGGFVVTDCTQKVVFRVDGCGIVGKKGELVLKDGYGVDLLLIRQKGGVIQALSLHKQWKGYMYDYEGMRQKMVFSLREPNACLSKKSNSIKIWAQPIVNGCGKTDCDFETSGSFPDRNCAILDNQGNTIAQIGVVEEIEKVLTNKDVYHVVVKPGIDQAFVVGVLAVLDYIYKESTRC